MNPSHDVSETDVPQPDDAGPTAKVTAEGSGKQPLAAQPKAFPHFGLALVVFLTTLFLGSSAQIAYTVYDGRDWHFLAEYFSYALAAFAALAAALTMFDRARMLFFWMSAISVVGGLILFTLAQGNLRAVFDTTVMMLVPVVLILVLWLSLHMDRVRSAEPRWRHALVGIFVLIAVVTELTVMPDVIRGAKRVKPTAHLTCTESYKDLQGNSSLACTEDN